MNFHANNTAPLEDQISTARSLVLNHGECAPVRCSLCPINNSGTLQCHQIIEKEANTWDVNKPCPEVESYAKAFLTYHGEAI